MRILLVRPESKPELKEIDGTLETMQHLVGGLIQAVYPFEEPVALICNDEGHLLGLPLNRALRDASGSVYDIVCGPFFLCGLCEDNFASLTEDQVQHFQHVFAIPEMFIVVNGRIVVLPSD